MSSRQERILITLLWGKVRRKLILLFRRSYLEKQMAKRQGACLQCGACCELAIRCPWFTADRLCKVYHRSCRPGVCIQFPVDLHDIEEVFLSSGQKCGYSFKTNETQARIG